MTQPMPTSKPRLNVSLPPQVDRAIAHLATRDHVPRATKALELLKAALEIDEDQVWDALAEKRDTKRAKFIAHDEAWQ